MFVDILRRFSLAMIYRRKEALSEIEGVVLQKIFQLHCAPTGVRVCGWAAWLSSEIARSIRPLPTSRSVIWLLSHPLSPR